jgi:RNA polymerase sigma-70 factor (ECF subfamily)
MASADEQNFLAPPVLAGEEDALAQAVRKAQKGDHAAFVSLYQRYKASIWQRLTYFVGEREAVQDLFQETFLRAWQKLPELKSGVPFESWLKRIAANIAIDYLRHEKQALFVSLSEEDGESGAVSILRSAAGPEAEFDLREGIRLALQAMSPQNRACVLLQDQWGFSQREIAQLLHISEKSVSAYVSRGHEQLRRAYLDLSRAAPEPMRKGEHDERAE